VNGSLELGRAFGIPIRLHWTFLVLAIPMAMAGRLTALFVLFGCVLLHELGHSLMAKRFGIRVLDITFWPLGGMARMSDLPEVPRVEGWIAIAGPLVNFVLVGIAMGALALVIALGIEPALTPVLWFAGINLALGTFNLLPAFPMDGGRVLRAWFGRRHDWVRATEKAVSVGRVVAVLMVALPLLVNALLPGATGMPCTVFLIAVFVWLMGARELMAVRMRHGLSPLGAAAGASGGAAGRFRGPYGAAPADATPTPPAPPPREAPPPAGGLGEARRPARWEPIESPRLDEAGLRELERFPGRLRRPPPDDSGTA